MDNIKDDFYFAKRLLKSIEVTRRYLSDKSMDDLINDGFLCDAIENRFTKIAEDAANLSSDFKSKITSVPWNAVRTIRNRVCHNYDVVDFDVLYSTIRLDFPEFRDELLNAIGAHHMNLYPEPCEMLKNRHKTVEMRLHDEKRQKLCVGDLIVFTNTDSKEEIIAEIVDLKHFDSFEKLYANYKKTDIGYRENEVAKPEDMYAYYSEEQIKKYGALAIELRTY